MTAAAAAAAVTPFSGKDDPPLLHYSQKKVLAQGWGLSRGAGHTQINLSSILDLSPKKPGRLKLELEGVNGDYGKDWKGLMATTEGLEVLMATKEQREFREFE